MYGDTRVGKERNQKDSSTQVENVHTYDTERKEREEGGRGERRKSGAGGTARGEGCPFTHCAVREAVRVAECCPSVCEKWKGRRNMNGKKGSRVAGDAKLEEV